MCYYKDFMIIMEIYIILCYVFLFIQGIDYDLWLGGLQGTSNFNFIRYIMWLYILCFSSSCCESELQEELQTVISNIENNRNIDAVITEDTNIDLLKLNEHDTFSE